MPMLCRTGLKHGSAQTDGISCGQMPSKIIQTVSSFLSKLVFVDGRSASTSKRTLQSSWSAQISACKNRVLPNSCFKMKRPLYLALPIKSLAPRAGRCTWGQVSSQGWCQQGVTSANSVRHQHALCQYFGGTSHSHGALDAHLLGSFILHQGPIAEQGLLRGGGVRL